MPRYESMVSFKHHTVQRRNFALKRLLIVLSAVGVTATLYVLISILVNSSWLDIHRVEVAGNHRLSATQIRSALGVHTGAPLFGVHIANLESRVKKIPWIKNARIYRSLPGILLVEVEEFRPMAIVAGKKMALVSSDGQLMPAPSQGTLPDLPVITNYPYEISTHGRIAAKPLLDALSLVSEMSAYQIYSRLSEIRFNGPSNYRLLLDDGTVELKVGIRPREGISAADRFVAAPPPGLDWKNVKYIDVRSPGFVAVNDIIINKGS